MIERGESIKKDSPHVPRFRFLFGAAIVLGLIAGGMPLLWLWTTPEQELLADFGWPFTWDFTSTWGGGWLVAHGRATELHDLATYSDALRSLIGPGMGQHAWGYPPIVLLYAVPLSLLPLAIAYALWTVATPAALWVALRAAGLPLGVCLATIAAPAALNNAAFGSNGALSAACLAGSLLLAPRRPVIAGILMGLLSFKPHLGVLLPVVLLASRNGRALAAAAATAGLLVVASGGLFGVWMWTEFVTETQPLMRAILQSPWPTSYQLNAVTVFVAARAAGTSVAAAYAIQALVTACCVVVAWRAWRKPDADPFARMALTAALSLLASPYGYTDDMVALSAGLAAMAWRDGWRMDPIMVLAWLCPAFAHLLSVVLDVPLGAVVIAAAAWSAWQRLGERPDPDPIAAAVRA
jgi:hypothetical protein